MKMLEFESGYYKGEKRPLNCCPVCGSKFGIEEIQKKENFDCHNCDDPLSKDLTIEELVMDIPERQYIVVQQLTDRKYSNYGKVRRTGFMPVDHRTCEILLSKCTHYDFRHTFIMEYKNFLKHERAGTGIKLN